MMNDEWEVKSGGEKNGGVLVVSIRVSLHGPPPKKNNNNPLPPPRTLPLFIRSCSPHVCPIPSPDSFPLCDSTHFCPILFSISFLVPWEGLVGFL